MRQTRRCNQGSPDFRHSSHPGALGTTSRIAERCLQSIAMFSCRPPLDPACIAAPPRRMRRALLCLTSDPIAKLRGKVPKCSGRKLRIDRKYHRLLSVTIHALFARNDRQLKHPRVLAFRQHIHENRFSVREREGIVMLMRRARLNRAKSRDAKACAPGRQPIAIISDVAFECEFGSGKQTYGDIRLSLCGKAAGGCAVEAGRNKRLANPGRAGCDGVQAIITHGIFSTDRRVQEPYREKTHAALTDVKISAKRDRSI